MISQHPPKYQPNDNVIHDNGAELIIIKHDEWVVHINIWVYLALSVRTNQKVYIREDEIRLKQ